jgi:hypothetical protein
MYPGLRPFARGGWGGTFVTVVIEQIRTRFEHRSRNSSSTEKYFLDLNNA